MAATDTTYLVATCESPTLDQLKEYVEKNGPGKLPAILEKKLNHWRTVPLQIAVTGTSGAGKSSFINAINGLKPGDKGSADVNVVESTKVPKCYRSPKNPNLSLWDLPGVGTPSYPRKSYLACMGFEKYEFFIIICSDRFRDDDLWLAKELRSKRKKFFFIRTKIDSTIADDLHDHPKSSEKDVLRQVKLDIEVQLQQHGLIAESVFLLSSRQPQKWDFPALEEMLVRVVPDKKREAMILSIGLVTSSMIEETKQVLKDRIGFLVFLASLEGSTYRLLSKITPGIESEVQLYIRSFNLDETSLATLSATTGTDDAVLKSLVHSQIGKILLNDWQLALLESLGKMPNKVTIPVSLIPILGQAIVGTNAYKSYYKFLETVLDRTAKAANEVLTLAVNDSS